MYMSPALVLFIITYMISFVVVISFSEWMVVWMGMEVNLFMFVVLIYDRLSEDSVESAFKYFFIQSMSSALLLIGMYMGMMVDVVLMMSMGLGPFFFWYLTVVKGMGWMEIYFLMILQKILPFFLLSLMWSGVMWIMVMMSLILGMMGALLESSMKGLMAFSSLNHMGWILLSQSYSKVLWVEYLLFYGLFIYLLFFYLNKKKVDKLMELQMDSWVLLMIFLVSLSGIPPLIGFFLKVMILLKVLEFSMFLGVFILFVSLVMFYVYFRVFFKMLLFYENTLVSKNDMYMIKKFFLMEMILLFIFFYV